MNYGDDRLPERFWSKCIPEPNSGCWLWIGSTNPGGYGTIKDGQIVRKAHRVSYESVYGEMASGLHIDHLCRVRCCVNPAHLEPVTPHENHRRGLRGMMLTRCPNGHEYSVENTSLDNIGTRRCRICLRKSWTEANDRRRRGMRLVNFLIPLARRLEEIAKRRGISINRLVAEALDVVEATERTKTN